MARATRGYIEPTTLKEASVMAEEERKGYVLRGDIEKLEAMQAETAKLLRLPDVPRPEPREPAMAASDIGLVVALDDIGFRMGVQIVLAERILSAVQAIEHRLS